METVHVDLWEGGGGGGGGGGGRGHARRTTTIRLSSRPRHRRLAMIIVPLGAADPHTTAHTPRARETHALPPAA